VRAHKGCSHSKKETLDLQNHRHVCVCVCVCTIQSELRRRMMSQTQTREDGELGALAALTSRERRMVAEGSSPSNAGLSGLSRRVRTRVRECVSFSV